MKIWIFMWRQNHFYFGSAELAERKHAEIKAKHGEYELGIIYTSMVTMPA